MSMSAVSDRTSLPTSGRPRAARHRIPVWARAGAVAAASLCLAGCAGSAGSSSGAASEAPAVASASAAADSGGVAADGSATGGSSGTTTDSALAAPLSTTVDRSIVVHADTTVRVDDVDAATARLGTIAAGHRATIATQATTNGTTPVPTDTQSSDGKAVCGASGCTTGYASSVTTLRLDNSAVDALLHDVAGLGTVEASSRTSDDVTAEVADVAARVGNARASLARVRALMTRASNVAEVVALEGELSKREADLEALEARQRTLADQSAQATVTVTLLSTAAPTAAPVDETGFLAGLRQGWTAFTAAMVAGLTVLGALVPFLVLLVPLALLGRWWWRRRRPAPASTEAPPATA